MPLKASWMVSFAVGITILISAGAGAHAQSAPQTPDANEEISTVFAFNRICYSQVPSTQGIRTMATQLGWQPLSGDDLEPFRTDDSVDTINAWDAQIGERVFRLGLTQGPVGAMLAKTFPDFKDGVATACTMVLDGLDPAGKIYADMTALAGKDPVSARVPDGGLLTTTWAGGNAGVKVFLVLKTDLQRAGNLLNVVVLTKDQQTKDQQVDPN